MISDSQGIPAADRKYIRISMKQRGSKLLRDFLTLSGGQLFSKIIALLAFIHIARTLEPVQYGAVEFAVALGLFFTLAINFGLAEVGARRIAQDRDCVPSLAAQIPSARIVLAAALIPVMASSGLLTKYSASVESLQLILLFSISLLAIPWQQDWLLQGLEMMGGVAVARVIRSMVFGAGVFICVQSSSDLVQIGVVEVCATAVVAAYYIGFQHFRVTPVRLRFSPTEIRNLLQEGSSIGLSRVIWAVTQYVPFLLLASLVGGNDTAWFSAANRIVVSLLMFSWIYHFNLYPAIARYIGDSPDELNNLLRASFRVVAWVGILMAMVITLLAEPLLMILFGDRFAAAAPAMAVLVWAIPMTTLSGHARWTLIAGGHQQCVLGAQTAGAAVMLIVGPVLIWQYQSVGAAIAMLAATFISWVVAHCFAAVRVAQLPFLSLIGRPLGLAALIGLLSTFSIGPSVWISTVILAAGFALCAPLIDPRLIHELKLLARAKSNLETRATINS